MKSSFDKILVKYKSLCSLSSVCFLRTELGFVVETHMIVSTILEGKAADKNGGLRPGDHIMQVRTIGARRAIEERHGDRSTVMKSSNMVDVVQPHDSLP